MFEANMECSGWFPYYCHLILNYFVLHLILCNLMKLLPKRIDDEDDEMVVNDQDVQRLVIVTQVFCW